MAFECERGAPINCLELKSNADPSVTGLYGGPVNIENSSIRYKAGGQPVTEPAYSASGGVMVNFTSTQFIGVPIPAGSEDAESQVNIDNPPPVTSIVIPSSGAILSGTKTFDASGSDSLASNGVTKVEYHLLGGGAQDIVIATAIPTIYGWVGVWDTTTVPNNISYELQSVAYDSNGDSSYSAPVPVVVHN